MKIDRPKSFIVAQGPVEHTEYNFWKMIYTNNIEVIIALNKWQDHNLEKRPNDRTQLF